MISSPQARRGITVLEVLIALGILAIGLASVAAIIPAAGAQGARAVILDRAAVLAANVLADAATFGLFRRAGPTWSSLTVSSSAVIVDLAGTALPTASTAGLRDSGVYSTAASGASPAAAARLIFESRDDILVTPPATDDDLPTNLAVDGARGFMGRMTSLLCLSGIGSGPYRASVVVFHNRDLTTPVVPGTIVSGTLSIATSALGGRQLTEIIRPGVVVNISGTFHQLDSAIVTPLQSADTTTTIATAFLSSSKDGSIGLSGTTSIQILPDSVGLAERIFMPETGGGFVP